MLFKAIHNLRPNSVFALEDDTLIWTDVEHTEPTTLEINAEVLRLQAEYESLAYSRSRREAYNLLNQDELRYDDLVNGTTAWPDAIAAIKLEFPK